MQWLGILPFNYMGPFHLGFFTADSNSPGISFCSHATGNEMVQHGFFHAYEAQNFVVSRWSEIYPGAEIEYNLQTGMVNCLYAH